MPDKLRVADQGSPDGQNDKTMQTFRMPRRLIAFLKIEAQQAGWDLTAQVLRYLEGVRTFFGLPGAVTALLDADREQLGMDRSEYLQHVLYQRSQQLREQGAGFDAPGRAELKAVGDDAP
jgi:hypothetical protein